MKSAAIEKAVDLFEGSAKKLADAIGRGVLRQNVEHWLKSKRVPSDHCPAIERATNGAVTCEELRPDVDWAVLRGTSRRKTAA